MVSEGRVPPAMGPDKEEEEEPPVSLFLDLWFPLPTSFLVSLLVRPRPGTLHLPPNNGVCIESPSLTLSPTPGDSGMATAGRVPTGTQTPSPVSPSGWAAFVCQWAMEQNCPAVLSTFPTRKGHSGPSFEGPTDKDGGRGAQQCTLLTGGAQRRENIILV